MKEHVPALRRRLIGSRVFRTEDPRLLSGNGEYIADIRLPGMLEMCVLRSPYAHARLVSINTQAAAAVPGVQLVWTGENTSKASTGIQGGFPIEGMKSTTQPILATEEVRFVGEGVAVVVAANRRIAEDACSLIEVEYDPLPAVVDAYDAAENETLANDTLADNVILRHFKTEGDVDAAIEEAAVTVSGVFRNNRCSASPIETRGCVARYDWTTGKLTLWSSTQIPHTVRTMVATWLAFPEHHLEVIAPDVGGGFGQKTHIFPEELLICLLSKELNRPVRWIEDRQENLLVATHAKHQINEMAISFTEDGKMLALTDRVIGDGGAYNCFPWSHMVEPQCAVGQITSVYKIAAIRTEYVAAVTNKCPIGAYRGVGWTAPQIARESLIDAAARKLGLSPFEIRRRNVVRDEEFPFRAPTGLVFHEGSYLATVDRLEEAVDYEAFLERQEKERAKGRYIGLGVSVFNEVGGFGTRGCYETGFPVTTHDTSTVRMDPTGKVLVTTSIVSQGQGHATSLAQVAADALGVPLSDVTVDAGGTKHTYGAGTFGSRGALIGAGSILRAADVVRQRVLQVAANLLEAAPEDLVLEDGRVHVAGTPSKSLPLAEVALAVYFAEGTHPPNFDPTLEATCTYDPSHTVFSNGAHAMFVEVDIDTGVVRIEKCVAVEDCGRMINPTIVEGQIRGGIAQGIGAALYEDLVYDDDGQLLTTTYMDYLIPTASEVPDVEIYHLETPSPYTPGGIKGMGESALISAPAAIVNAVNDALSPFGVLMERFPMTPERIVKALESSRAAA